MTKLVKLTMMIALAFALTTMLEASAWAWGGVCRHAPWLCEHGGPTPTPEIDPNVVRGTITVLVGGVLMLAGRLRRR